MRKLALAFISISAIILCAFHSVGPRVIYGDDNRTDVYEVEDQKLLQLKSATTALIDKTNLQSEQDGSFSILGDSYGEYYGLCENEPFFDQPASAFCSGFLVSEDLVVTAGHCIESAFDCQETAFVFGYEMKDANTPNINIPSTQVYNCSEVVAVENSAGGNPWLDYAVVRLDRAVEDVKPLSVRRAGQVENGTDLMVIGNPSGLPTKIADDAFVRDASPNGYFVANLDTYGGNSGSAVINIDTLKVEGILVRGETDFIWDFENQCRTSKICENDGCSGESVTDITFLSEHIPMEQVEEEIISEPTPERWWNQPPRRDLAAGL